MNVSQWNSIADREGFIVVYPSGTGFPKRWQAFPQEPRDSSKDVIFIADLIDSLSAQYNIDPARIYVNGFSNGGGMTFLLGCELADRIAATGTVAGAFVLPFEECAPSRPMPLIAFHGTADPIVPFLGGPSESFDIPFLGYSPMDERPRGVERLRHHSSNPSSNCCGERGALHRLHG